MERLSKRDECGVTLIEVAIVLPLLLLFIFGAIEWGMVRQQQHALSSGVREGARRAVVAEWGTDASCTASGPWAGTVRTVCATKAAINEDGATVFVKVSDHYRVGENVTVCAQRPTDTITGVMEPFIGGKTLRSETTMRIEELGNGGLNTGGDGGDWSWCG